MTARTPEQDGARLAEPSESFEGEELSGPRASRRIRRRLTFRADEAQASEPVARKGRKGKFAPSPWQRAHEAWRHAGIAWDGNEAAAPEPAESAVSLRRPSHGVVVVVAGLVLVAGVATYAVAREEGERGPRSAVAAAVSAEGQFIADPSATTDGLIQDLAAVAAHGSLVVAAGAETAGDGGAERERAQFLVSADSGRNWRLADVHTPDGAAPPPGDRPLLVAGGDGAWAAIGQAPGDGQFVFWTSVDVRTWTREVVSGAPFGPKDKVYALARTANGFVAVGVHSPGGRTASTRGVMWTSPDGRVWRRNQPNGVSALTGVAANSNTLVAHGTFIRKVTKTVKPKGQRKARKVTSNVHTEALWRSTNGGQTLTQVNVPQGQGAFGPVKGVAAGTRGFYVAREGRSVTGPKKKRTTTRYGVLFGSPDGASWTPAARLSVPGYQSLERLSGSVSGYTALVRGKGKGTVLLSNDGRTWRPGSEVSPDVSGLAMPQSGAAIATGARDADGFLALAGAPGPATPVDLTKVPGAVRPERTMNAIVPGPNGQLMVVGSTGGDAAAWATTGGSSWKRVLTSAHKADPVGGLGQGRRRLIEAAHGTNGWLAIGTASAPKAKATPLVLASPDGATWTKVAFPKARTVSGVTNGPNGYVVVGVAGSSAASWRSTDLKRWTSGKHDVKGTSWMRDVAATSTGYVAAGGRLDKAETPAIWTSTDGAKWTAATPPALPQGVVSGAFFQLAARGNTLVALGWGKTAASSDTGFVARSADGGRTWFTDVLPGMNQATTLTAITPTAKGFLLAATQGAPGRQDVRLWSWTGAQWKPVAAHGTGLDGPGDQRLTALTAIGNQVVGTGISADHRGETPMLWRTPTP